MTSALGIAAVTRTMRNLLDAVAGADYGDLPADARPTAEIRVTTLPLDRVRNGDGDNSRNHLNLFLYHTEPNAAWRNQDIPRQVRPGESARPPLPLNLYYILTAYGQNDSELVAHVLLGMAMRILHDHPTLGRAELHDALPTSGIDAQFERVRITPQPVSLDEVSKLWTGFQSEYRLSAAYQVSVVLIESELPSRAPLPVLRRGSDDRGPIAVAAPGPTLLEVREFRDPALPDAPARAKPAAELGDVLVLRGSNLGGDPMVARFRHARRDAPLDRPVLPQRSATEVRVALPSADDAGVPFAWPAGFYTVELLVQRPELPAWATNRLPFALAPTVDTISPLTESVGAQPFTLTVTCRPQTHSSQRPTLLLGERDLAPDSLTTPEDVDAPSTLVFTVDGLEAGGHVVRLRVDGADSIPVDFAAAPPQFDGGQILTITP